MQKFVIVVIGMTIIVGCAARNPVAPETGKPGIQYQLHSSSDDPHRMWGQWKFFISANHDHVDVVPEREGRFHLNALKFLESYCSDCLKITGIKNNGDGTIDLTVQITHPFKGFPQYTGFDVKGIIMFNGSHVIDTLHSGPELGLPNPTCLVSWLELGDPQVLNPDGYTLRWSPSYNSGSSLPIFNYWKGHYATGDPNADLNAYLDFYSTVDRHMFAVDSSVSRTYKIWLPAGKPLIAGYAVEACWEPPTTTPVTDPLTDFPPSANQPEPYHVKIVVNNGNPVKYDSYCCDGDGIARNIGVEIMQWGGVTITDYFECSEVHYGTLNSIKACVPSQFGIYSFSDFAGSSGRPPRKFQWLYSAASRFGLVLCTMLMTLLSFEVVE